MAAERRRSWRRIAAGWAGTSLAVMGLAAGAGPGAAAQRATRDVRERHVFITVLNRNDVPVTDLTTKEVVVKEDGAVREIVSVTRATTPMQIVLLVDDSQATDSLTAEIRQSATSFVGMMARNSPDSEMSLWTFGERPTRQVDFTSSVPLLTRAIGSLFPRVGAGSYLMEALVNVSTDLKKRGATRPIIVAFLAEDGPEFSTATEDTVTYALKGTGAALWSIVLQARPDPNARGGVQIERRDRTAVLSDDAAQSGGGTKVILDRLGLESAFASIASRLGSQLDVAYARPDRLIPPSKIDVTVTRPGVRVQAPHWAGQ